MSYNWSYLNRKEQNTCGGISFSGYIAFKSKIAWWKNRIYSVLHSETKKFEPKCYKI